MSVSADRIFEIQVKAFELSRMLAELDSEKRKEVFDKVTEGYCFECGSPLDYETNKLGICYCRMDE